MTQTAAVLPATGSTGQIVPTIGHLIDDVSFRDYADGNFVAYLSMNEMIQKNQLDYPSAFDQSKLPWTFTPASLRTGGPRKTPDTSGHNNVGTLLPGAYFPLEYHWLKNITKPNQFTSDPTLPHARNHDFNPGFHGRAIYFSETGGVSVANSPSLTELKNSFAAELFVKRLHQLSGGSAEHFLIFKPGTFAIIQRHDGRIHIVLITEEAGTLADFTWDVTSTNAVVPLNMWTHIGVSFTGVTLTLNINGSEVQKWKRPTRLTLVARTSELLIGPSDRRQSTGQFPSDEAVFLIDEVAISNRSRKSSEFYLSAFGRAAPVAFNNSIPFSLPLGLSSDELKVRSHNPITLQAINLGRKIFNDKRFSGGNNVSCASCHMAAKVFSDAPSTFSNVQGIPLTRNTMSLYNRIFSLSQFWDTRAPSLETQALAPLVNPMEMNSTTVKAIDLLRTPEYAVALKQIYNVDPPSININHFLYTLSDYERFLVAGNSRVDRFEAGEQSALNISEQRGYDLFHGKGRCVACHSGSNFTDEKVHNTGFFAAISDVGAYAVTRSLADMGAFKTPSLRDVELTPPYLHNGSLQTLSDVVNIYNKGGNTQASRDAEIRPLNLTTAEVDDLVNFLKALTSGTRTQ